jgi:hypothetical protein
MERIMTDIDVLTEKGTTDAGKQFAKINGVVYDVPGYVLPSLDKITPGDAVGFKEYNNILTRIYKKQKPRERQATITTPAPGGNGNGYHRNERLTSLQSS